MENRLELLRFAIDKCEQSIPAFKSAGWDTSDMQDFINDCKNYITETLVGNPAPEPEGEVADALFRFARESFAAGYMGDTP